MKKKPSKKLTISFIKKLHYKATSKCDDNFYSTTQGETDFFENIYNAVAFSNYTERGLIDNFNIVYYLFKKVNDEKSTFSIRRHIVPIDGDVIDFKKTHRKIIEISKTSNIEGTINKLKKKFNEQKIRVNYDDISWVVKSASSTIRKELVKIVLDQYNNEIDNLVNKDDKLKLIIKTVKSLGLIRPFPKGNCRTFFMLLLQFLLKQNKLSPFVLSFNPNDLYGISLDESIKKIKKGQTEYKKLQKSCLLNRIFYFSSLTNDFWRITYPKKKKLAKKEQNLLTLLNKKQWREVSNLIKKDEEGTLVNSLFIEATHENSIAVLLARRIINLILRCNSSPFIKESNEFFKESNELKNTLQTIITHKKYKKNNITNVNKFLTFVVNVYNVYNKTHQDYLSIFKTLKELEFLTFDRFNLIIKNISDVLIIKKMLGMLKNSDLLVNYNIDVIIKNAPKITDDVLKTLEQLNKATLLNQNNFDKIIKNAPKITNDVLKILVKKESILKPTFRV
ncbi:MAG: hypothetical protein PVG30_05270 [Gammaproteobacteria bacterium]